MKIRSSWAVLLTTVLLSACARSEGPAPYARYGNSVPEGAGMVSAREGDTVYTIASFYRLPVRDIIDANGLYPPYEIKPGQRVKIPAPPEYRVQLGDSIYSISQAFAIEQSQLVKANNIEWPYYLKPGQMLRIPGSSGPVTTQSEPEPVYTASPVAVPTGADTGFETTPIAPGPESVTTEELAPPPTLSAAAAPPALSTVAAPPQPEPVTSAAPASAVSAPAAVTPAAISSTGSFVWPVQGKILSGFGPKAGGLHNDGINIAAPKGSAVRVADGGEVAYVGDDLGSYGNLVLVRHANGWMTAYGHLSKSLVQKGDIVTRGQAIGTVGSTGTVDSPQLHFEIRQGGQALNPQKYLGSG